MTPPVLARLLALAIGAHLLLPLVSMSLKDPDVIAAHAAALGVAFAGGAVGCVGLLLPASSERSWVRPAVVMAGGSAASLGGLATFGTDAYEPSLYNIGPFLAAALVTLGMERVGILAGAILLGAGAAVSLPRGLLSFLAVVAYGLILLILASLWRRLARRLAARESAFRTRGRDAVEATKERERARVELRLRTRLTSSGAVQALERVADLGRMDDALRSEVRRAEAALRDDIRCPGLVHPLVTAEVAAARNRGVDVLLVGDPRDQNEEPLRIDRGTAAALAEVVRSALDGEQLTIRHFTPEVSGATVSVVRAARSREDRLLLGADGVIVDRE